MKLYIPRTLSSSKLKAHGTTAALMKRCLIWQWLHNLFAPGYSLWDQLGHVCKKHNSRIGLWRLACGWERKSDDCPLSETLKAPHFYKRRNLVCVCENCVRVRKLCVCVTVVRDKIMTKWWGGHQGTKAEERTGVHYKNANFTPWKLQIEFQRGNSIECLLDCQKAFSTECRLQC